MALHADGPVRYATAGTAAEAAQHGSVFHSHLHMVAPAPASSSSAAGGCGTPFEQPWDLQTHKKRRVRFSAQ